MIKYKTRVDPHFFTCSLLVDEIHFLSEKVYFMKN